MKTSLLTILAAASLAACATSETSEPKPKGIAAYADDPRLGEKVDRICHTSFINGFGETTRSTVIMSAGPSKKYLIETYRGCMKLDHAQGIGLDPRGGCASRGDSLIVSESAFSFNDGIGTGPQRCAIKAIYKWNNDAVKPDEEMPAEG